MSALERIRDTNTVKMWALLQTKRSVEMLSGVAVQSRLAARLIGCLLSLPNYADYNVDGLGWSLSWDQLF